ncbi:bis(5'-nucleosyl)-tetraphosphatase (symmetrical) YqeK [Lapidilactobacillus bayanensis]|uniref:bis(5'-nucleosyl)-tetraphosphatase (symmetrical) YqeK n=1 Tax=Lapidilactobacillus bayanensis TaxID=2485998 RepID=UPI001CDBE6F1|nr:bis(5'-nucleosyl)-tetraphosphatase (symmetrical) YqeK [Lapidilactobacillus bayanensis]
MSIEYDPLEFKKLVPHTREELVAALHEHLSDQRAAHCLRVEQQAMAIAYEVGADVTKAGIAGLLHDYAKERSNAEFVALIKQEHLDPDLLNYGNAIWHGVVGRYFIEQELHIYDEAILQAVARHTVGDPEMTTLDKIIFVADFVEPGRDFPGVNEARAALKISLAAAVAYELQHTILYLVEKQVKIFPRTFETYNVLGIHKED